MVGLWHWIGRNSAGLSLLVPFLAIGGGLLGNWLGAKVQAAGGLAQASAAREEARITAEASRGGVERLRRCGEGVAGSEPQGRLEWISPSGEVRPAQE